MRPHRAALAAALAGLVLLTGCQSDPEPRFADPTASPPPVSGQPTSAPPTPSITETSTETAQEFLRRFQSEAFEMQRTGDTSVYRRMTSTCSACKQFADSVDDVYRSGGSAEVGEGSVTAIRPLGRRNGFLIFDYDLDTAPGRILDAGGKVVQRFDGGPSSFQVSVRKVKGTWVVTDLTELT